MAEAFQSRSQAPKGTLHKKRATPSHPASARPSIKRTDEQTAVIEEELKLLPDLIKAKFTSWANGATPIQLQCMSAQVRGQDTILHAATGAGKTGIAAGPYLLPSSKGKVTLFISPLLSLHEEQVTTFKEEFGLSAIAINSNSGTTKESLMRIVAGKHQIVILSPEMLLSRRFIDNVLRKSEFGSRCLSVFIDEAHCISLWGDSFRKKYASISIVRAFLPKSTPFIAVSATLTPRVYKDLLVKLQMDSKTILFVNAGNERSNVTQVVRAMEHPMNSYRDADFIVPDNMQKAEDIPKTFLYCDDIKMGDDLTDYLNSRIPEALRSKGLVRPYNAAMSKRYRRHVMSLFKAGIIRILVCTDAAGMGCNIPDVDVVVQWKAPRNLSSWVQRAGRAARASGRQGLAVMLVEKSAFDAGAATEQPELKAKEPNVSRGRGRGRGRGCGRGRGSRGGKHGGDYAVLHGQRRGTHSGAHDVISPIDMPLQIEENAPGEGLYSYIQETVCRRRVLNKIFGNNESTVQQLLCCDLCNPRLFNQTRPGKPLTTKGQKKMKKGEPVDSVRAALYGWRSSIKKELYPRALWASHAILDNATCELLSSIGPVKDKSVLESILAQSWGRWHDLGQRLFECLSSLDIPAVTPIPSKKRGAPVDSSTPSTPLSPASAGPSDSTMRAEKRPRTSTASLGSPIQPPSCSPPNTHCTGVPSQTTPPVASSLVNVVGSQPVQPMPRPAWMSSSMLTTQYQHLNIPNSPHTAFTYALPAVPSPQPGKETVSVNNSYRTLGSRIPSSSSSTPVAFPPTSYDDFFSRLKRP